MGVGLMPRVVGISEHIALVYVYFWFFPLTGIVFTGPSG
jgi:hypothetical protein